MARSGLDAIVVLVRGDDVVAEWPLSRSRRSGLAIADELARLQLAAKRMGCRIELRDPGADLLAVLDLVGLRDVVRASVLVPRQATVARRPPSQQGRAQGR